MPESVPLGTHIHGCGHPTRALILNGDPISLIMSGWFEWNEEHDTMKNCICFWCWEEEGTIDSIRFRFGQEEHPVKNIGGN